MSTSQPVPFTASELAGLQVTKYFNVAGMAVLIFDYAITLEDEARLVWGRSWDITRFIFTVSRYLPFVGMGLTAYAALRSASQPCPPSIEENIIHALGIIAAELLLIFRTYAFWQGNKRVLYGLLAYGTVTIAGAVTFNVGHINTPFLRDVPVHPDCPFIGGTRNGTFVYLFLLVFEIVILFLTAYKQFHTYRKVRANLVRTVYRDAMLYILCIILITFANVIIDGILPSQFSDLLDVPQIALHSVLASRIMFNLRKTYYYEEEIGMIDFAKLNNITPPGPCLLAVESESPDLRDIENVINISVDGCRPTPLARDLV